VACRKAKLQGQVRSGLMYDYGIMGDGHAPVGRLRVTRRLFNSNNSATPAVLADVF